MSDPIDPAHAALLDAILRQPLYDEYGNRYRKNGRCVTCGSFYNPCTCAPGFVGPAAVPARGGDLVITVRGADEATRERARQRIFACDALLAAVEMACVALSKCRDDVDRAAREACEKARDLANGRGRR